MMKNDELYIYLKEEVRNNLLDMITQNFDYFWHIFRINTRKVSPFTGINNSHIFPGEISFVMPNWLIAQYAQPQPLAFEMQMVS